MKKFFLFLIGGVSFAFNIPQECLNAYKYGVLDTIKTFQDQKVIQIENSPYWLVEDVSTLGKGEIILKMAKAERDLLTPVLIWYNGGKYIVYAFDSDPYHLKEMKKTAGLENAEVVKSKDFVGFRRIYLNPVKECNYPIYTLNTLIFALKKRVMEDIKNPRKRERILNLIRQIENELKPTTESEVWELLNIGK